MNPPPPLSPAQRSWQWRILAASYFAYGGYYLTRKAFTICKTSIARDLHWELGDTAHIWTAYLVAYMLGMFVISFLGRRTGPRVLLLGGLGISMGINLIFGFTNSFSTFLTFMFFNGLVQASGWPGSVGAVAEWLRAADRGTVMGFWSTSYNFGNMMVKSLGGFLLEKHGWRWSFWGCTLLAFAIWWLIYFWQRNRPQDVGLSPIVEAAATEENTATQARERVSLQAYLRLVRNPIVLAMGASYFCVKFLRYALDSWLPAFLNIQGLDEGRASYYSQIFDFAGIGGVIVAGWAMDKLARGNWALVCACMATGIITGYVAVMNFGHSPTAIALWFGLVGFMLYGPDTLLCGAASVQVAGEKNALAVAGLVNGMGSAGSVLQEEVIGWLVRGNVQAGIAKTNSLALGMSILLLFFFTAIAWRLHRQTSSSRLAR